MKQINWQALLDDLGQHGYTINIIALSVGDSPRGLSYVAEGTEQQPRKPSRERLVDMWALVMQRERGEVPTDPLPIDAPAKAAEAQQDQATPSRAEAIKTETPDLPVEVTDMYPRNSRNLHI